MLRRVIELNCSSQLYRERPPTENDQSRLTLIQ